MGAVQLRLLPPIRPRQYGVNISRLLLGLCFQVFVRVFKLSPDFVCIFGISADLPVYGGILEHVNKIRAVLWRFVHCNVAKFSLDVCAYMLCTDMHAHVQSVRGVWYM